MSVVVDRATLASELAELRAGEAPPRVVLANGCFDLLHVGHVRYLELGEDLQTARAREVVRLVFFER